MKDYIEAVDYNEALDYVSKLVKEQVPLFESIIKQIHHLVLADKREDRSVYRRVPARIMQPYFIESQMKPLLQHYVPSCEYVIPRLAQLHIELGGIHSFIDGNGRTQRLLVNFEWDVLTQIRQ